MRNKLHFDLIVKKLINNLFSCRFIVFNEPIATFFDGFNLKKKQNK